MYFFRGRLELFSSGVLSILRNRVGEVPENVVRNCAPPKGSHKQAAGLPSGNLASLIKSSAKTSRTPKVFSTENRFGGRPKPTENDDYNRRSGTTGSEFPKGGSASTLHPTPSERLLPCCSGGQTARMHLAEARLLQLRAPYPVTSARAWQITVAAGGAEGSEEASASLLA
jgi:hypothetical protein